MLHVAQSLVEAVRAAPNASALYEPIQLAIELEHSTLPPYLAALFSLDAGRNKAIAAILKTVVNDEMLHMAIMANLLNAIGGEPAMNDPAFVPKYPGKLPMSVGNGVLVGIAPFSIELVRDVFMKIEEPETPLEFPERALEALEALGPRYATIGEFYRALSDKLGEYG